MPKEGLNKYCDIIVFCKDALITQKLKIGPATVFPCTKQSTISMADQIKDFCDELNIYIPSIDEIKNQFDQQDDKVSPNFAVCFPRVQIKEPELYEYLKTEIKIILGLIALNRQAYPKEFAVAYFFREGNQVRANFIILESYYRGNLAGGFISGENEKRLNQDYDLIKSSSVKMEILNHYKSANAEIDLDYAYLRYWSLLEAIAKQAYGDRKIDTVRNLIKEAYKGRPNSGDPTSLGVDIGSEYFSFEDLTEMWYAFRNYTAHEGGFFVRFASNPRIGATAKKLFAAMEKNDIPFIYGEERTLFHLKDIVNVVVKHYLSSENGDTKG